MKKITLTSAIAAVLMIALTAITSCKKKYDAPPEHVIPESSRMNIAQVKAMLTGVTYKFTTDANLYCTVIADETTGSFYKESYVRDATGAMHITILSSGGLYIGDSIRINLKGVVLTKSNGNYELDSINVDNMITKQVTGLHPQPIVTTLAALTNTATNAVLSGQLVKITGVEFNAADQNQPYAYAATQTSANRMLKACDGNTVSVYTSGYANFASVLTPSGNGSVIGIMSLFSGKPEMTLRTSNEVVMTGALCNAGNYVTKDFNDNSLTSGGWTNAIVTNTIAWVTSTFSTTPTPFAKVSGYVGGNTNCETWLISPVINLAAATNPNLYFQTAAKFAGNPLEIVVSTDYVSGAPSTGTWTNLTAALSPTTTSYVWTPSGTVSLSGYKTANTHIAFKYQSTTAGATTYELDDIIVKEN